MKTVLFILMLPLTLFFTGERTSASLTEPETGEELMGGAFDVDISIGRPNHDCTGFGVCDLNVDISFGSDDEEEEEEEREEEEDDDTVDGEVEEENGQVQSIIFDLSSISKENAVKYFGNNTFVVQEGFRKILQVKGKKVLFSIKKGKYPLKRTRRGLLLDLRG